MLKNLEYSTTSSSSFGYKSPLLQMLREKRPTLISFSLMFSHLNSFFFFFWMMTLSFVLLGVSWNYCSFFLRRVHTFSNTIQTQFLTHECPVPRRGWLPRMFYRQCLGGTFRYWGCPQDQGPGSLPESWMNLFLRSIALGIFHEIEMHWCASVLLCWLNHWSFGVLPEAVGPDAVCCFLPFQMSHGYGQRHKVRMLMSVSSCLWSPMWIPLDTCSSVALTLWSLID